MLNSGHFEAKKHAYRQTQDGVVVSFVIHPDEVPADMATAPLGTIYMIGFQSMEEAAKFRAGGANSPSVAIPASGSALDMRAPPAKSKRSASQRAAWLTKLPEFWAFINSKGSGAYDEADANDWLLRYVGVDAKRNLDYPANAAERDRFLDLEGNFRAWQQAKGHGAL